MSTTQRVLGFVAGLAAIFVLGLGLGQVVDLEEPAPGHETPSHESSPEPSGDPTQAPSPGESHAPGDHETEVPDDNQ